eukprot:TRINITY_DN3182_c0_g1_i1.p1 TRINITY_DN3182_c0_g1~~TRINITY_DN3182_c0_g1_i1.p1  ORF type:complete len:302 (+),score=82.99 TRINITY_DN3182_c0_g1_i1:74-907(+)
MSKKQTAVSSFFTPTENKKKRKTPEKAEAKDGDDDTNKKAKASSPGEKNSLLTHLDNNGTWYEHLSGEFQKPYFQKLTDFLKTEQGSQQVFPPPEDIFTAFNKCKFEDVRVVIIGQDPYHDDNQAHGLSFSVKRGIKIPPSLRNMYKELSTSVKGFKTPTHGFLESWATQGVLMLNAVLTVRAHKANSHKAKGWEKFTDSAIALLNEKRENVVFLLWGGYSQKKGKLIDRKRHHVIEGVHPSPLSASKGWYGSNHFNKANEYLKKKSLKEVDWKLPA